MKKEYPVIKVKASGIKNWSRGARTMCFVYSKNNGNFILEGYLNEVNEYLNKNYTNYFYYHSFWRNGETRGYWCFWKKNVYINEPDYRKKQWKYKITSTSKEHKFDDLRSFGEAQKEKVLYFKRLPKCWIPEFDLL